MSSEPGIVYLVGAGPGDPGLLTLRGMECLQRAEFVLYDGLVNPILLRYTTADCQRTSRMQGADGRRLNQEEINEQLIAAGKAGKVVVRLKGGDPFMFGRGSEEAAALRDAGIPFEVVPGITAATAAGVFAGISLTHRRFASCVAFVTGHEDPDKPGSSLDYANLAQFSGTLVFYMGLHRLPLIAASLMSHGKNPDTPACVISRASRSEQRTVYAPLHRIADDVRQAGLPAPSLIIVGDCVQQRESIAWFEQRPLLGQRILITRPVHQAGPSIDAVVERGGQPVLMPLAGIQPVPVSDSDWNKLNQYDWIVFTSANGIRSFFQALFNAGHDLRCLLNCKLAVVGPSTAAILEEFLLRPDFVPQGRSAATLADELRDVVANKNVLWPRGDRARNALRQLTESANAFEELVVYSSADIPDDSLQPSLDELKNGAIDWVTLSSPAIAERFLSLCDDHQIDRTTFHIATMSPQISATVRDGGFVVAAEAETTAWPAMLGAIEARLA